MRSGAPFLLLASLLTSSLAHADANDCSVGYQASQRDRNAGRLVSARASLVQCSSPTCPKFIADDCTRWLAEVDAAVPTVVLASLAGDGSDLAAAVFFVDDVIVPNGNDGLTHEFDPGEHTFELRAQGQIVKRKIVLRTGEKSRRIELRLETPRVVDAPPRSIVTSRPVPIGTWIFAAATAVFAGVGTGFWIVGSNDAHDYNARCASPAGCSSSDRQSALRELVIGDVAWMGAAASAITSVVFFVTRPTRETSTIGLKLGPASAVVFGRF